MDPKKYHYNRFMKVIVPDKVTNYVLLIDENRRFAKVKGAILKRLLTICEGLAN